MTHLTGDELIDGYAFSRRKACGGVKPVAFDYFLRRNSRNSRHSPSDHGFRCVEIFLQKHRRERENIADIIETVPDVVRRKFGL